MKNQITSKILKFAFAFLFILIAASCSEDNDVMDAAVLAQEQSNSVEISGRPVVATVVYGTLSYSSIGDICLGDPVTITFDNNQGYDNGLFKMRMYGPTDIDWVNLDHIITAPNGGIVSYTFTPTDLGNYKFKGEWNRTGGPTTGTNTGWVEANPLFTVVDCATPCTESASDTAYAGNNVGGNVTGSGGNGAWWFALDIGNGSANITADVWKGQTTDIGDVTYNAVSGMITITFANNWFLATGETESVKWYSYTSSSLPTNGRPTPGQAPNKGTSLSFPAVSGHQYYAIHLDVATCL